MLTFLLAAALTATAVPGEAEVIRLKVGTEVIVELDRDSFDEAVGITAYRVDDGSRLNLRWDQMLPEDVKRIRASFGFLPDEPEPILVPAVHLVMTTGAEFTGLIVEEDDESFRLRQGNKVWPLRWKGVRSRETIWVDALEVYDAEEFYAQKLSERVPQTALDHYNLSLTCESLQLWSRSREHLLAAQELDPTFKAGNVTDKLKRAEMRMQSGEDAGVLAQVLRLANREMYDKALNLAEGFLAERGGSKLRGEFEREVRNIRRKRERWIVGKVTANFFAHLERFALKVAGNEDLSLRDAVKQMEKEATPYAIEAVARQLGTEPEEVQAIWEDPERSRASVRTCSYGAGTFTLGEKVVFADMDKQKEEEEGEGQGESRKKADTVQERIKQMLEERKKEAERRKKEARSRKKERPKYRIQDVPPNKDEWWAMETISNKKQFLLAWWAEHDPHAEVVKIFPRECQRCGGAGVLKKIKTRGNKGDDACTRCKTLRIDRVVRYQ